MTTNETPTVHDIDELKRQWLSDGCWDIESTEGFECHHLELLEFRLAIQSEQEQKMAMVLAKRAEQLADDASGLGLSQIATSRIYALEGRLEALQADFADLHDVVYILKSRLFSEK